MNTQKIGRNDPCPCGSGKKYKRCHGEGSGNQSRNGPISNRSYSTLNEHTRVGKKLVPPFLKIPNLRPMSWSNDRLPELLWAGLLICLLPREKALIIFRGVGRYIHSLPEGEKFSDITHSGLAALTSDKLRDVLKVIVCSPEAATALSPLLLFAELPGVEIWREFLVGADPRLGWDALKVAVARTLFHQSQESTDCRWLRVLVASLAGKLVLAKGDTEKAREILEYPNFGDLRKVRPSIRATEGVIGSQAGNSTEWPSKFWQQCMKDTPCFPLEAKRECGEIEPATTKERVCEVFSELNKHFYQTQTTTDVDSRHDAAFGMGLYCVSILEELLRLGMASSLISRVALRTLTECCITLAYLLAKESPDLWKSYRAYGAGQAKLSFLKLEASSNQPTSVDSETLSQLANEDAWQELVPVELGHWDKSDLRKMSEEVNIKDVYDQFYGWTSTYLHGQWCAIRDSVYDTCGNPLHRLHRVPRSEAHSLPDVVLDACRLTDRVLDLVSAAYPKFLLRTLIVK